MLVYALFVSAREWESFRGVYAYTIFTGQLRELLLVYALFVSALEWESFRGFNSDNHVHLDTSPLINS